MTKKTWVAPTVAPLATAKDAAASLIGAFPDGGGQFRLTPS